MDRFALRESPDKGRGVFATRPIPAGSILFADPVVELDRADLDRVRTTALGRYWWHWNEAGAVVFGLGSMLNHSDAPNVACQAIPNLRAMQFTAIRPIEPGEELTLDYATNEPDRRPSPCPSL